MCGWVGDVGVMCVCVVVVVVVVGGPATNQTAFSNPPAAPPAPSSCHPTGCPISPAPVVFAARKADPQRLPLHRASPLAGSVRTSCAPKALSMMRRSRDMEAGMVRMSL
jgi:hypothetical protein